MTTVLHRTTFETSRLLEFFTEKELQMQIGHPRERWPVALLKELIDNSLDACESAGIPPEITITVEPDALTVLDNGPGLPATTLERSLDYTVRVSDKAFYISPTRGQLGNALKCAWAAAFVANGGHGCVEVSTGGVTHVITVTLDRIEQRPQLKHTTKADGHVKTGTQITLHWPGVASCMADPSGDDSYTPEGLLRRFAAFNPHATFHVDSEGEVRTFGRVAPPTWRKWRPDHPTSAHWYSPEQFKSLLAAYVTADRTAGRSRTVRDVVAEFAGLSGTAKQKQVTDAAGLTGARIEDLIVRDDLDMARVSKLLTAMKAATRPIPAKALGAIGKDLLTAYLRSHWALTEKQTVRYHQDRGEWRGLPHIVETALVVLDDYATRTVLCGLNFSPVLNPDTLYSISQLVGMERIEQHDPILIIVHLTCPQLCFADHAKSVLLLHDDEDDQGEEEP